MPTRTQHPGAPTPPENTAATSAQIGAQFTPEQRAVIITALAAGTPVGQIARMLGRPYHHVDRWVIRHKLHTRTRHSNHLVVTLALLLLGTGLSAATPAEAMWDEPDGILGDA